MSNWENTTFYRRSCPSLRGYELQFESRGTTDWRDQLCEHDTIVRDGSRARTPASPTLRKLRGQKLLLSQRPRLC